MGMAKRIPRLVIAAAQSGAGKTTVATGLMAALSAKGYKVQPFKVGPDYIDPGYHSRACGRPAENLDSWLVPPVQLPQLFAEACAGADIAIVEGVMGLYDGGRQGVSSTAEIAKRLQAPVLLVIDTRAMGASAAALALGFRDYDPEVRLAGVLLNRLGSDTHEAIIREACAVRDIPVYGAVRRGAGLQLPERYLGLVPTEENLDGAIIHKWGEALTQAVDLPAIVQLAQSAPPLAVEIKTQSTQVSPRVRIGIARDEAFSFYYASGLHALERLGAALGPFSPLHDRELPEVDGCLLGGGFPEQFAAQLAANVAMREALRCAAEAGLPIYAECGGYMYLLEQLQDLEGHVWPMTGIFPGRAVMTERLQMVGYVTATLQQDCLLGPAGTSVHGHEFHFSQTELPTGVTRPWQFTRLRDGTSYAAGQVRGNVLGSYLHVNFAGCPAAAQHFLEVCRCQAKSSS